MNLPGRYFDGLTSSPQAVTVTLTDDGRVLLAAQAQLADHALDELRISARIGNTPRRITLPGGAVCEIADNDALDAWLSRGGAQGTQQHVFNLERQWSYAVLALLLLVTGTWTFIQYGVPALAERVAMALPTTVDDRLGSEALAAMDDKLFKATQLSRERQQALQHAFQRITAAAADRQRYRLEFRQGGKVIGANAFALPSGTVVMTDELVAMAKHDNELIAVLAHEVGHVAHRHSLRMLLQTSASTLVMFTLLGDISAISSLAATLPTVLTQAKYSRALEQEADDYAYAWMEKHGIAAHYFTDILLRLEAQHGGTQALSYFSSHPQSGERQRR